MKPILHTPALSKREFGQLPGGEPVECWTLAGRGGLVMEVLTYGGIVRSMRVPKAGGEVVDVVLGYETLAEYVADRFWMGATAGRVAGRIAGGRLKVGDKQYQLPLNEQPNHLHGGPDSFNKRVWQAEPVVRADGAPSLRLSLVSADGDNGYPGEVRAAVVYTIADDNSFIYETHAEASALTPVALTHHSYFNLTGDGSRNVLGHEMQVFCEEEIPTREDMTLTHQRVALRGGADLRKRRLLKEAVPQMWQGHGALYWTGEGMEMKRVALVLEPTSGLTLEVHTDESCVQTYFGRDLHGAEPGKQGKRPVAFGGLCLECQGYTEAANIAGFGNILVGPGQPQHHTTRYVFGHT